jgi:glycosyltransferase involved in cell wall biosynthesis
VKIAHITQYCLPATSGGTERYIADLIRGLASHGVAGCIGWFDGSRSRTDTFEAGGAPVIPLPAPITRFDPPPHGCLEAGKALLAQHEPDLLHFHTFGRAEALLARLARARGIPYTFTYHSPAWNCRQGSLFRWGRERCDGEVRAWRCSACRLQQRLQCPPALAWMGTAVSAVVGVPFLGLRGNAWRRRGAFVYESHIIRREFREFLTNAAVTISCCEWSVSVLERNGAPSEHLVRCAQGVPLDIVDMGPTTPHQREDTFTVGFVGRLSPVKGARILVDAFRRTDYADARLRIFGWSSSRDVAAYARGVEELARSDPRITFAPMTPFEELLKEYRKLDLLAIPSDWPETGPLVMLEAFGIGVPAWGSDGVGQLDMLRQRGRVISPNTPESWFDALEGAFEMHRRHKWHTWADTQTAGPLRSMLTVADEMLAHYREMLGQGGKPAGRKEEQC